MSGDMDGLKRKRAETKDKVCRPRRLAAPHLMLRACRRKVTSATSLRLLGRSKFKL